MLWQCVRDHVPAFLVKAAAAERPVPEFVRDELERFLRCGILEEGCAVVKCESCGFTRLVAFSCKGRSRLHGAKIGRLGQPQTERERQRRYTWSQLLARVFAIDVLECPRRHARTQRVEWVTRPERTQALLNATGPPVEGSQAKAMAA